MARPTRDAAVSSGRDMGRDASLYRLTARSRRRLGAEQASWRALTEAVVGILAAGEAR